MRTREASRTRNITADFKRLKVSTSMQFSFSTKTLHPYTNYGSFKARLSIDTLNQ